MIESVLADIATRYHLTRRPGRWAGQCPYCGGSSKTDRFDIRDDGGFKCWSCQASGQVEKILREVDKLTCPESYEKTGRRCDPTDCPVRHKCRLGDGKLGASAPRPLAAPQQDLREEFRPDDAVEPAERWRQKAREFVGKCHRKLLETPEQLEYLAGRGIPRDAVIEHRLGWNPGENGRPAIFRSREAWGLPTKLKEGGKKKRLWIPRGIVIPAYREDQLQKVRIRRPKEDRTEQVPHGYHAIEGGGDDVPVFGESERAFVVVEADLCGIAVAWACRGLAGAIPLASCSVKPRTWAAAILEKALCILVATDYDPGTDERTGRYKNPGGKAARWWAKHYPRAERWPIRAGKDPGDYVGQGGDLRAWVETGLIEFCPAAVAAPKKQPAKEWVKKNALPENCPPPEPQVWEMTARDGRAYFVAEPDAVEAVRAEHPGAAVITPREVELLRPDHLHALDPENAALILSAKEIFEGSRILGRRPLK